MNYTEKQPFYSTGHGYIDELILLRNAGISLTTKNLTLQAASSGQVQILDFFNRQYRQLPVLTQEEINEIATLGRVDVLEWLIQHGLGRSDQRAVDLVRRTIEYLEGRWDPQTLEERVKQNLNSRTRPVNAAMRFFRIPRNWDELRELLTPEELDEIRRDYIDTLDWLIR